MNTVQYSSAFADCRTPSAVLDELHQEFQFTMICTADSAGLSFAEPLLRSWRDERVSINPPYGRHIALWMEKAWTERNSAEAIVALVPCRTDTAWWHDYVMKAEEIRFVRGRLFVCDEQHAGHNALFATCVVVWR